MIGERLQDIRKDHNDTQQDLADKLHASLYAVRCWEQGKSDPSHDTLVAICKLYGVSADYLLGRTDNPEGKLYGQPKIEKSDRMEEFIEMCFDPSTNAHAKLKETLKKMLEEQQGERK